MGRPLFVLELSIKHATNTETSNILDIGMSFITNIYIQSFIAHFLLGVRIVVPREERITAGCIRERESASRCTYRCGQKRGINQLWETKKGKVVSNA